MIQHLLTFEKLIGTKLIKLLYYLGLIGITLFAIVSLLGGLMTMTRDFGMGIAGIVMAIVGFVVGIVFWRFICELYILFFRISDDLRDIKNNKLGLEANKTDVF